MADIVRFKGFNIESDAFVEIMEMLERDVPAMRKIATTAADMMLGGGAKKAFTVVQPLIKKWIVSRKIVDTLVEKMPELSEPRAVGGFSRFLDMLAKIVAKGIITDIYESPFSYRKFIDKFVFRRLEMISEERGKQKLKNMLKNRGIGASERTAKVERDDFKQDDGSIDWDAYREAQALEIGNSRGTLKKRLMSARSVLNRQYRAMFKNPEYDFGNKRLISDDGTLALQWATRRSPKSKPNYNNQQTSKGVVFVVELKTASSRTAKAPPIGLYMQKIGDKGVDLFWTMTVKSSEATTSRNFNILERKANSNRKAISKQIRMKKLNAGIFKHPTIKNRSYDPPNMLETATIRLNGKAEDDKVETEELMKICRGLGFKESSVPKTASGNISGELVRIAKTLVAMSDEELIADQLVVMWNKMSEGELIRHLAGETRYHKAALYPLVERWYSDSGLRRKMSRMPINQLSKWVKEEIYKN